MSENNAAIVQELSVDELVPMHEPVYIQDELDEEDLDEEDLDLYPSDDDYEFPFDNVSEMIEESGPDEIKY